MDLGVGSQRAEQAGGDFGKLHRGPLHTGDLSAGLEGEASRGVEGADQAADPRAGLERTNNAVVAGELGQEGTEGLGDGVGDDAGGV
jgi:hypothetical protein